ncbi:MAG: hypothetical protein ABIC04_07005 [Nanoarchaeota archaeon]
MVGGAIAIKFVMKPLWTTVQNKGVKEEITQNYPCIVGYIERFLYTTALLSAYPGFIGIWLAFKVTGRWERAKRQFDDLYNLKNPNNIDPNDPNNINPINKMKAHAIYYVFIIGNGLSITYAVIGYKIIDWIHRGQNLQLSQPEKFLEWSKVILIPLLVILATLILEKLAKDLSKSWANLICKCSSCGQEFYASEKKIICLKCSERNTTH